MRELAAAEVPAGAPCPAEVADLWRAGSGYAVCIDFQQSDAIRRWSDERKATARKRNLSRRIERAAPLFADELVARELAARPEYYQGKTVHRGLATGKRPSLDVVATTE